MKFKRQWFANFYFPGAFMSEESSAEVDSPDPNAIELPENSYGFYLYYKEYVEVDGKKKYFEGRKGKTGTYFAGKKYSTEELESLYGNDPYKQTLISNSRNSGYVVQTKLGNWQQFYDGKDHILGDKEDS